jgi:ElaA protein
MLHWSCKPFHELTVDELYAILRLRSEVFVVEQKCIFLDLDGKDQQCLHLMGWESGVLATTCRIVPPGLSYDDASIGRVVSSSASRRTGAGKEMMRQAVRICRETHPDRSIRISAQSYLITFYSSFGFEQVSDIYLEDDQPHAEMLLR